MKIRKIVHEAETRKKNVAAYARVSTLMEEQEESFDTQVTYFEKMIKGRDDWNFVEVYADHGKSGLSASKRPNFLRMMDDAFEGKIDLILVKSVSRFGRNSQEIQEYVHLLRAKNVEVWFDREQLSSFDNQSEMFLNFLTIVSQEQSRNISNNVRWTYQKLMEQGIRKIGNKMYGFDEIDGVLVPNEEAWVCKMIIEEYAEGVPIAEILKHLNEQGISRKRCDSPWDSRAIHVIIRNEAMCGDRIIQKLPPIDYVTKKPDYTKPYDSKYIKNDHEAIVSRAVWNKAQEREKREKKEREAGIYRSSGRHYMYGRLFCGECNLPLRRRAIYYHGVMQKVWKCSGRDKNSGCKNDVVSEAELFEAIAAYIGTQWGGEENFDPALFDKVERVDVYKGRKIKITLRKEKVEEQPECEQIEVPEQEADKPGREQKPA